MGCTKHQHADRCPVRRCASTEQWLKQEKMGRSARAFGQQDLQLLRAAPEGADAPGASHAA